MRNTGTGTNDSFLDVNRSLWDGWTRKHVGSLFYDVEGFKRGNTSLQQIERDELGSVRGKTLLHLQCHFGQDTLSWVREGAIATGVDFSDEAIREAHRLSEETGLPARFIRSNLYDLLDVLDEQFDVVFTSYGVLGWLPDINAWARVPAHFLKPGGVFYIVEFHPLISTLDDDGHPFGFPYFHQSDPFHFEGSGSYAVAGDGERHESYEWNHSISDIVTALLGAGLRLEFLHEFPYCTHNCWSFLTETEPGRYSVLHRGHPIPCMFSIRATKPA